MKYLIIALIGLLIQGCASGPISKANVLFNDYGGGNIRITNYPAGYFEDDETVDRPEDGDWPRRAKKVGKTNPVHHLIFGHFKRRAKEADIEGEAKQASEEARVFLTEAAEATLRSLGLKIVNKGHSNIPFTYKIITLYTVVNDDLGCRVIDECVVMVHSQVAHIGKYPRPGATFGGANSDHRVLDAHFGPNFITIRANETSSFDERIFYKTLSENLPETVYVYLNASPTSFVQVKPGKVMAYPFLLNQGKVIKFEVEPIAGS